MSIPNTSSSSHVDAVCSRYARLNKQGCITSSPCTSIRWVPHSTNLFLVSHADGTCILYDKDRDDGSFSVDDPPANGWDQLDSIVVTTQKESKTPKNPMSHWRVSRKKIVGQLNIKTKKFKNREQERLHFRLCVFARHQVRRHHIRRRLSTYHRCIYGAVSTVPPRISFQTNRIAGLWIVTPRTLVV